MNSALRHFNPFATSSHPLHSAHMVRLSRWFLLLLALMLSVGSVFAANSAEERAFSVAMGIFPGLAPDFAEKDFAEFIRKYPNSIRVPEAVLYEAQAMLFSGQRLGAIDLLSTNQERANQLAPEYLYWLGRARFQNNEYQNAADTFNEMLQKVSKIPAKSGRPGPPGRRL